MLYQLDWELEIIEKRSVGESKKTQQGEESAVGNKNIVRFGSIIFTRAEILFFNSTSKKGVVCIHGNCAGRKMQPIKVTAILDGINRHCSACGKEIFWFISGAKTEITNYLPTSNELSVRVEVTCECGAVKTFSLLLSLGK